MTPTPRVITSSNVNMDNGGKRVVISGMSGVYPQSRNVQELATILYEKINPVTADKLRWDYNHPELSQYSGKAPEIDRFDAQFFKVHYLLANNMDAMSRKLLEHAYQAIYDAGINPLQLNDKKIGVFIGTSFTESERTTFYHPFARTGHGIAGCSKSMFANRISYWLNLKGPSMTLDSASCSTINALEQAYSAIRHGECEGAIVAGCSLCFLPQTSLNNQRLFGCPKDGKVKSFGQNADGCSNSDAINAIYLQNAEVALRVYAEVIYVKSVFTGLVQDDTGPRYGFCRSPESVTKFINEFYDEAQVSPKYVEYVEAVGSALPEDDKSELQTIELAYLKDRTDPLLVGSVISNIGFTQAASGLSAVTKVLLGYHTGVLAANLHCEHLREDVAALREGRMRIVTEHQHFNRTYTAVNSMSVTGVNSHLLLHGRYKPKDSLKYSSSIPRLVNISGRQESGVHKIIKDLKSRPIDPEELALLHNIHATNIAGHLGRGYVILDVSEEQKTVSVSEKSEYFDDVKRPLWFVYSGMGSQWTGMAAQLMRIQIFAAAIERCQRVLEPKGLDLVHIITSSDETTFKNILHSFVGITAVQIGLTDILQQLGLKPNGIIGHSVGELGCAYADGCLTAEETILAAYARGRVSLETPFIRGSMAAVGLGYEQISRMLPPDLDVACHNGPDSSTISGPADKMHEFIAELVEQGIFAKEVPCSNIAYHSRYIAHAGPELLKYLNEIVKKPKPRSERWLSTSVPQNKWYVPAAKMNSAQYHTNNLLSPVLFDETSRLIPPNAVLVEVAPHGLLQAILKRSLSADCRHVPLTKRGHADSVLYLLQAIGNLYTVGYNPQIQKVYPKVQFPVSTGTPMLSQIVEWNHHEKWNMPTYLTADTKSASSCRFVISTHDDEHKYLQGNVVRGKPVFPFAAALTAVWDTLAMFSGSPKRQMSVRFQDVHLYVQPILYDQHPLRLHVMLHSGSGRFEVMDGNSKVAVGFIYSESLNDYQKEYAEMHRKVNEVKLQQDDVYQLLQERDYLYSGEFRSIECTSASLCEASLVWEDNWVTLIDGMLQLNVLRQLHDAVSLPTHIRRMLINVDKHRNSVTVDGEHKNPIIKAEVSESSEVTICGGVLLQNVTFRNLALEQQKTFDLQLFTPDSIQILPEHNSIHLQKCCNEEVSLQMTKPGSLGSLYWAAVPKCEISGAIVKVHYAGLNTLDAQRASGSVNWTDNYFEFGMDFSGTLSSGVRVMGIVPCGAASSEVVVQPELLWPLPPHWSLEDAATVPLAYLQAFYCLAIKAQLREGMIVLVHGGAGALGQAVISVALALHCTVFTTVSDARKKMFLKNLFPELKNEHIGNSRDGTFKDMILNHTKGKGCDIAICCSPGELRHYTLRCLKTFGITFDFCQLKHRENLYLGMYSLEKDRTYTTIDITSVFKQENSKERKMLHSMLSEGIVRGYVRPLSRVTYAAHSAARAFSLLAASAHRGRVLLQVQPNISHVQQRVICSAEGYHIIVSDDQCLCMHTAEKLVNRGARKLYIISEHDTSFLRYKIRALQRNKVDVKLFTETFTNQETVNSLLKNIMGISIEGIFVAVTKIKDIRKLNAMTDVVKNVDLTSRILCPSLKYFAVATIDRAVGYKTCMVRAKDNLPASLLDLSSLSDVISSRDVVNAWERALCSPHPIVLVKPIPTEQFTFLQDIENICGKNLFIRGESTLQELGVTDDKVLPILSLLRDSYNMYLEKEDILTLSMNRVHELNEITSNNFKPVRGLATFFSYIDPNEHEATTEIRPLPTLALDIVIGDEFDLNQSYLYIVPGMEGHYERFRVMCERLKLPALVLQPGLDHPYETVRDTAQRLVKVLMKRSKINNGEFYILGYESGILVALEMAVILEGQGLTGTIFCVGFSPEELQTELEQQLACFETEEQLQDAVLRHMYTLFVGDDVSRLNKALQHAVSWSDKLNACIRTLLGRVPHSAQYIRALVETAFGRIKQVRHYSIAAQPLRSRLVVMRAASQRTAQLHQQSLQPLAVHQLRAPLAHAAYDMRVSSIINKYLNPDILQTFDKKNLCNTYYVNRDLYLSIKRTDLD